MAATIEGLRFLLPIFQHRRQEEDVELPGPPPLPQIELQAHWNSSNVHLASSICHIPDIWEHAEGSYLYKIYLCFTKVVQCMVKFLLTPFKRLCAGFVVPVSFASPADRRQCHRQWTERWSNLQANPLMTTYEARQLQVTAPDGSLVNGVFYRHQRGVGQDVPTIVCFGGNGELAKNERWDWLLKKGMETPIPFNVVVLDYRAELTDLDQCILDGDSVIQALHEEMGVSKSNIHMMGYSLGGGVSAQIRNLHQDLGNYVNLRSFSSIGEVLKHSDLVEVYTPGFIRESCIGTWVKPILEGIVCVLNWSVEAREHLRAIGDRVLVVYHPQDPVIPGPASSAHWMDVARVVEMRLKRGVLPINHHIAPLNSYEDGNGLSISKRIMNFILQIDHFQRRQPV